MTMKSQHPVLQKPDPALSWHLLSLPAGFKAATIKTSTDGLELALPSFDQQGLILSFINFKGDVRIRPSVDPDSEELMAGPGIGLLSEAGKPLYFCASAPVHFSALLLFLPENWNRLFLDGNVHFIKIQQILSEPGNIITCRLGRRQMSLLTSALNGGGKEVADLLQLQNSALSLLEYVLCNRHRGLLGANPSPEFENEDDLSLIREVESYISEYYCSDTFTVDSILKKTYTSYHRLNFLFKSIHGMTISEYIRNKRIEKSREMIADNAKSISQIAYEIGYSSISNYILAFKKVYQITPGKYKKQIDNLV